MTNGDGDNDDDNIIRADHEDDDDTFWRFLSEPLVSVFGEKN